MRLYIPKDTCLITFLLAGISCPKATRPAPGGAGVIPGEPFGAEALEFTKDHILQREVQIEVSLAYELLLARFYDACLF